MRRQKGENPVGSRLISVSTCSARFICRVVLCSWLVSGDDDAVFCAMYFCKFRQMQEICTDMCITGLLILHGFLHFSNLQKKMSFNGTQFCEKVRIYVNHKSR